MILSHIDKMIKDNDIIDNEISEKWSILVLEGTDIKTKIIRCQIVRKNQYFYFFQLDPLGIYPIMYSCIKKKSIC